MAYKNFKKTELIEEIGSELRKARTEKGFTMNQVAAGISLPDLHLSPTMLSRIENGERRIDDDLLQALCDYYQTDAAELIIRASKAHINKMLSLLSETKRMEYKSQSTTDIHIHINELDPMDRAALLRLCQYNSQFSLQEESGRTTE